MITCKEDLINTYIENDHGELRDLYIAKCKEFNITVEEEVDWYDLDHVMVDGVDGGYFLNTENDEPVAKQLTLSDLKPRTKVEYEKVTLSVFEKIEILESGEWLYLDPDGRTHIDMNCAANWTIGSLRDRGVYRKVERPVEWWEDALEYVVSLSDDDIMNEYDPLSESISIKVSMNRKQAQDFARIILEQEGE